MSKISYSMIFVLNFFVYLPSKWLTILLTQKYKKNGIERTEEKTAQNPQTLP